MTQSDSTIGCARYPECGCDSPFGARYPSCIPTAAAQDPVLADEPNRIPEPEIRLVPCICRLGTMCDPRDPDACSKNGIG